MGAYEFGSQPLPDCDANGMDDGCEINPSLDCDGNEVLDACDIAACPPGTPACNDCNKNGIPDGCDIASETSEDENANGVPDECQVDCDLCPTDADGDGDTGPIDLSTLLVAWGPILGGSCLDTNGDGDIGPVDLATLLVFWGPCP